MALGPHFQFLEGGTFSGQLTLLGAPTWQIDLTLYRRTDDGWAVYQENPDLNDDRSFTFWSVRPGTYRLGFAADGHQEEFWPGAHSLEGAQDIQVTPGSRTEGFDATLEPLPAGAVIRGRLSYPSGSPVVGAAAVLHRRQPDGSWLGVASGRTGQDGSYAIDAVHPGTYRLEFAGTDEEMIGQTFWGGSRELDSGRELVVPRPAADVTVPEAVVEPGGVLCGHVASAYFGSSVSTTVVAYRRDGGSWVPAGTGSSYRTGNYAIYGLPAGEYRIGVFQEAQVYAPQFYPGTRHFAQAGTITLAPQEEVASEFSLAWGVRNLNRPSVQGTARVGRALHVRPGMWSPHRPRLEYQWLADGRPIRGGDGATYRLRNRDAGKRLSVRVTGAFPDYLPLTLTSAKTGRVRR